MSDTLQLVVVAPNIQAYDETQLHMSGFILHPSSFVPPYTPPEQDADPLFATRNGSAIEFVLVLSLW
jgi:hypothetical protein